MGAHPREPIEDDGSDQHDGNAKHARAVQWQLEHQRTREGHQDRAGARPDRVGECQGQRVTGEGQKIAGNDVAHEDDARDHCTRNGIQDLQSRGGANFSRNGDRRIEISPS